MATPATALTGMLLAAGAGTRMGMPKALMHTPEGESWLGLAVSFLRGCGCDRVLVVLGARAEEAVELVPPAAEIVIADDWAEGMSASLRAGLAAASGDAVLLTLVDLPGMSIPVGERVLRGGATRQTLRQAVFAGQPGHPVLIGADHWTALAATLAGDRGARRYLAGHGVDEVECGDLFDGADIDHA